MLAIAETCVVGAGTAGLTVCSVDMEHYRSTLAFTAFAACGLVAAGHILRPGNYNTHRHPVRIAIVTAEAPSDSSFLFNPRVTLQGVVPAALEADSATVLAPRLTVVLSGNAIMEPPVPSALVKPVPSMREVKADPLGELIRRLDHDDEVS